jgi:hypothetical protein
LLCSALSAASAKVFLQHVDQESVDFVVKSAKAFDDNVKVLFVESSRVLLLGCIDH